VPGTFSITEARGFFKRRTFLHLPWPIYKGDANWVPPLLVQVKQNLDVRRNPFYRHARIKLFLAHRNGRPAGRIAAVIDESHNTFRNEKTCFFGFFECINDRDTAAALLEAVRQYAAAQGMDTLTGPLSPSLNHECATLVEGFDSPPQVMMPYNPPYYPQLLEACGLAKAIDVLAYHFAIKDANPKMFEIARRMTTRSKIELRNIDPKQLQREVQIVREIYNQAWANNWGFVPADEAEFEHLARELKAILEPSLAFIGFIDGKPAGFSLALPNINEALKQINGRLLPFGLIKLMHAMKHISSARLLLLGVVPEYRHAGLDILFYTRTIESGIKLGYAGGELSWVLEDNTDMRKVLEKIGARVYKRYRFYTMPV